VSVLSDVWSAGIDALRPPEDVTPTQWAESDGGVYLSHSDRPGPFCVANTPYLREPIDAVADRLVRQITFMSSAQVGKTTMQLLWIGYSIDQDPSPCLLVFHSVDYAKSFAVSRMHSVFRESAKLARHLPKQLHQLDIQFANGARLDLTGANSPGNVAGRPIQRLYLDEIDKYRDASEREAGSVLLAEKRVLSYSRSQVFKTSTPTNTGGAIWLSFLAGDQRFHWVPCPYCGERQILFFGPLSALLRVKDPDNRGPRYSWPRETIGCVRWDSSAKRKSGRWDLDHVRDTAGYECGHCKRLIGDDKKAWMVARGEWRPEAENRRHRSYQMSALYALWESCSFSELAVAFLQAKGHGSGGLQDFANSYLGEPNIVESVETTESAVRKHVVDYELGTCPGEPGKIVCTVDVQQSCLWFVVRAWAPGANSWLLDYGRLEGFAHLDQLLFQGVYEVGEKRREAGIDVCWIDSGDRTLEVYDYCRPRRILYPYKGTRQYSQASVTQEGKSLPGGRRLMLVDKGIACDSLYERRLGIPPGVNGFWAIPRDTEEIYFRSMASWVRESETDKWGNETKRWVSRNREFEHLADCEITQEAAASSLKMAFRKAPGQGTRRTAGRQRGKQRLPG